jgi:parallel beta-helix repeat protein
MIGIQVNSGKPTIQASLVRGLGTGITLGTGAGAAFVTGTTISGNTTGISLGNTGQPTVTLSQITNNATGILVSNGNPTISSNTIRNNTNNGLSITGSASGQITGNVIDHNNTGLLITVATGGDPRVNFNSIFCNSFTGADVTSLLATHLENNSWNRDTITVPSGPRVDTGNCLAGADICPRSGTPMPIYTPFSAAVSGGCP